MGSSLATARQGAVKRGVKAGHLRHFWMALAERLDQFNLAWQMIGVIRHDAMQFIEQFRREPLRIGMGHAMHYPMAHGFDRREARLQFEPVNQTIRRRPVIGDCDVVTVLVIPGGIFERQIGTAKSDTINPSMKASLQRFANLVECELDAR